MGPTLPTHLAGQIQFRLTWTKTGIPTGLLYTDSESEEEHYSGSLVMFEAHRARPVPLTL